MKRRVVVTGIGAVTPLGHNTRDSWNAIRDGRSGVGRITLFDTKDCPVLIAAEVKNFEPVHQVGPFKPHPGMEVTQTIHPKDVKKMGRFIHFAIRAGLEAYGDSGIDQSRDKIPPERIGAYFGVGLGGLGEIEDTHCTLLEKGYKRITPFFIPQVIANLTSGHLSNILHLKGPNLCNVTACASSAHALGEAYRLIQRGDADIMLSGGAEAVITPLAIGGFAAMRALSTRNDEPEKASRPFDIGRDGFVMGEGSGALVLEEYEHARSRGARMYAEIVGYGLSGDAYHITLPAPEGEGGLRAMAMSLKENSIQPEMIGYINTHGTATPAGDTEEIRAVAKLFPEGRKHLHISSTKSVTGHLLGAAGAVESIISILAMRESVIPPTMNLDNPDPECTKFGINLTPNSSVQKKFDYALSNSFGFGGTNACLVFKRM